MQNLDIRFIELEPIHVVSFLAFGPSPELDAWQKLAVWIEAHGLAGKFASHRFFGFNNPDPTPASPNYGYEQWMTVDASFESDAETTVKEFSGGLYAVTRCISVDQIFDTWQKLVTWREDGPHQPAYHQYLEECLTPEVFLPVSGSPRILEAAFDLYLPVGS